MKPLEKDELYQNLHGFLKSRGVELNEGSYAAKIQKSCSLLSEAINASQHGLSRAKNEIDKKLDQLRQVIHEKTAPSGSATPSKPAGSRKKASAKSNKKQPGSAGATKTRKSSKKS